MFNLNLFIATVVSAVVGAFIAYLAGNFFAGVTALGVGAASYWLVIAIEGIRRWVWFRK
jgi:hypothetical protein